MGVGIVNDLAYDPERDYRLKQIENRYFWGKYYLDCST